MFGLKIMKLSTYEDTISTYEARLDLNEMRFTNAIKELEGLKVANENLKARYHAEVGKNAELTAYASTLNPQIESLELHLKDTEGMYNAELLRHSKLEATIVELKRELAKSKLAPTSLDLESKTYLESLVSAMQANMDAKFNNLQESNEQLLSAVSTPSNYPVSLPEPVAYVDKYDLPAAAKYDIPAAMYQEPSKLETTKAPEEKQADATMNAESLLANGIPAFTPDANTGTETYAPVKLPSHTMMNKAGN